MKKISTLLTVVFSLLLLASCNVEPLDPELLTDNGAISGGTSSGDYWPTQINNEWTFEQNGVAQSPMKIISSATIGGALYYQFNTQTVTGSGASATNITTRLNKSGGIYNLKTDDLNINAGGLTGIQTGYTIILLKDNIPVGQTWTGNYSQSTTYTGIPALVTNTTYTGTILAKNVTETVNGEIFNNVIKMNLRQENNFSGTITVVNTEYWFAKSVGPIKTLTTSGGANYVSALVDYTIY
jgi:hypothetical protein